MRITVTDNARNDSPYGVEQLVEIYAYDLRGAEEVIFKGFQRWEFGPSWDVVMPDGRRKWITYPGGMKHSAYYANGESNA